MRRGAAVEGRLSSLAKPSFTLDRECSLLRWKCSFCWVYGLQVDGPTPNEWGNDQALYVSELSKLSEWHSTSVLAPFPSRLSHFS